MARPMIRELDRQRIAYEAMTYRIGAGAAALAFCRAMNHQGRIAMTQVRRATAQQASIRVGDVSRATKFVSAGKRSLKTIIRGTGGYLPLRYFGARQFKYGVRAKVWGEAQQFKSAFIVASLGGNVFKNTRGPNKKSGRNNAIEKLFGPAIPNEMIRDQALAAFEGSGNQVAERAMHELTRILSGGR